MTSTAEHVVLGSFSNEQATMVEQLHRAGFPNQSIKMVTGADERELAGKLSDIGIPREEVSHYASGVRQSNVFVALICAGDELAQRAASIMNVERPQSIAGHRPGVEKLSEDERRRQPGTTWPHEEARDIEESLVSTAAPEENRRHRARIYRVDR